MPTPLFALALSLLPQLSAAAFEKKVADMVVESGVPGAALEVFRDGQVIHRQAVGLADVDRKTPYSTELDFEIGSLSKQFTATAILLLVNDGKLSLTDTLGALFTDLPEAWRAVTVEQLLHHVSGIPDYEEIAGYDFYNEEREAREIIASAASRPPSFRPGERFEYSNTGYYLLSLIVEKKGGVPFDRFLAERLFAPLGMSSTYTRERPPGVSVATGYHSRTGARVAQPPIAWTSTLGAGGIVSTLADFLRWDEGLYTERLLPDALRRKLWEPVHANDGSAIPYGAGWFSDRYRDVAFISHSGQTNGFTCYYLRFPEAHLAVLVHSNTYDGRVGNVARAAAAHFLPALNYYSLSVPADSDPDMTSEHVTVLRQAVLAEGDLDRLATGMKRFATEASTADMRKALAARLNASRSFRLLRERTIQGDDGPLEEFLYRQAYEGGELFWTLRFTDGYLSSLDWDDE